MARASVSGQLDERIDALLQGGKAKGRGAGGKIEGLVRVAEGLRGLPREEFRNRLRSELEGRAIMESGAARAAERQQTLTTYLTVADARAAIEFYKGAFGAVEKMRLVGPGTRIGHAELAIGDSLIMLADEFPEFGSRGPKAMGGSPAKVHLQVPDVDAVAKRAVELGAKVIHAVQDQFYGERSGQFEDPFGYVWIVSTHKETLSPEEMQKRFDDRVNFARPASPGGAKEGGSYIRKGFHTITPYLIVPGAAKLMEFIEKGLGGKEVFRVPRPGSDLIMHAEAKVGDSMVEMADAITIFPPMPAALHLFVPDVDAVYRQALDAGATSLSEVVDQPYGERSGSVRDAFGNFWYIATHNGPSYVPEGHYSITPYLHPLRAPQLIEFMTKAFGAAEVFRAQSPDGVVHHAQVRIGDSLISMGEAHGIYEPMPTTLHMYVPNADETFQRALAAGSEPIMEVKDQPYGERSGGVKDPFGNRWFIATHLRDVIP